VCRVGDLADVSVAFNDRGAAYIGKREYDRAIQDYDEAIRLVPSYARAFNNRGAAYMDKREYDFAIRDFDQAIKLRYLCPSRYYCRRRVYSLGSVRERTGG